MTFSSGNQRLAVSCTDGGIRVWDLAAPSECLVLRGHGGSVRSVRFTPDCRWLVSAENLETGRGWAGEVWLWNTATHKGFVALRGNSQEAGIFDLAISPDGTRLATAHGDGTVRIWSVEQLLGQVNN